MIKVMFELTDVKDTAFLKIQRKNLTGSAKWADIEDLINRWARRNPPRARALEAYIKMKQQTLLDPRHALMAGKSKGAVNTPATRMGVCLDPQLLEYIQAFYPKFLSTKDELHEFKQKFPKFRIPEK